MTFSLPMTRRGVLAGGAALAASLTRPATARAATPSILRAVPSTAQLAPDGYPATPVWSYATDGAGIVPGPELRVKAGDRITRRLVNDLPQSTAVHWHGIRIDNAMDGAAPLTQAPVPPGKTFDYDFVAPDPGTYWYHSHDRGYEQVARGLAGPLIVEDRTPWLGEDGAATREMTLVLDDWLLNADAALVENFDSLHAASHAGRLGNTVTVNGTAYPDLPLRPGERVRLRLINTATARVMPISFGGLRARLIALDGHPVAPRAVDTVLLGPAQRADVVIDAASAQDARGSLLLDPGNGGAVEVAGFPNQGDPMAGTQDDVRPLPAWGNLPTPDLADPQRETLLMEGGAMRGFSEATYDGETLGFRELASRGMVWAFNGIAHGMDAPMFRAPRGRTVHLSMTNRTAFAHAIHLHGHHFRIESKTATAETHGDIRDTALVGPDETLEVAFVADNPGRWMIHCHMLEHQQSGMMGWFDVA
ncbi:multicopper oxidase family protein [Maribius pontilimi]|uniref:Multicopper oxidase family protein n=1 Tax=Palleronia pontilimi TaxID=1964209 RepID=A0A934MBW3_9RHOB|nr:multicopper oxidase family protein [Palleronia pontilimi]MBJ3762123.1 multicopper oxidase family protein [Palleronia pontilimi]